MFVLYLVFTFVQCSLEENSENNIQLWYEYLILLQGMLVPMLFNNIMCVIILFASYQYKYIGQNTLIFNP